jgi:rhamnogalacturonyl hydrolase YesR
LAVATAIASRFMRIPPNASYMWHVGRQGILDLFEATGDQAYLDFYLQTGDAKTRFDWRLHAVTGDRRWLEGAEEAGAAYLADARRDREGSKLDPSGRYTVDVLSGHFTLPVVLGSLLDDPRYFDDAWRTFEIHRGYLEDPETGLWFSRWGHSLHQGRPNPGLWSRGNGWLIAAWGRVAHLWHPRHHAHAQMQQAWRSYCESVRRWQQPSGLFRQLLNREGSFEEATGTGLFATGFAYGVIHGTLPDDFAASAQLATGGLAHLVDDAGNIHNVSTYAGGYNFEQQYESCARLNDPHGDGTVMSGCAAVHLLAQRRSTGQPPRPQAMPKIVTAHQPIRQTNPPPSHPAPRDVAQRVLRRALSLTDWPEHDHFGQTVQGLLHWHDIDPAAGTLATAERLFHSDATERDPFVQHRLAAELRLRRGEGTEDAGLLLFADQGLRQAARDRHGLIMDEAEGYRVETLARWVPLLMWAWRMSGEARYLDEACALVLGHQRWLEEPVTRLWFSAYGRGDHPRRTTPGLWSLGNGYALVAVTDLLQHLPREHRHYGDVLCLLRRYVEAAHTWMPVLGGWTQLMNRPTTFACTAGTAWLGHGCGRALLHEWMPRAYWAVVIGSVYHLGELTAMDGRTAWSSRPSGGLNQVRAYDDHRVADDPAALGPILSACSFAQRCVDAGFTEHVADPRLGAR